MSEMFQIIVLMAVPVVIMCALRWMVIRQNRRLDTQVMDEHHGDVPCGRVA
ncbi:MULTISPECIES: hypothetical protein [unclassified Mycolicibacterium]|uniref:hypothetical protein n=1 Tax=unclassified Mycolicibacterium TaxID=2636767 RepID=UPI002EDA7B68